MNPSVDGEVGHGEEGAGRMHVKVKRVREQFILWLPSNSFIEPGRSARKRIAGSSRHPPTVTLTVEGAFRAAAVAAYSSLPPADPPPPLPPGPVAQAENRSALAPPQGLRQDPRLQLLLQGPACARLLAARPQRNRKTTAHDSLTRRPAAPNPSACACTQPRVSSPTKVIHIHV